MSKKITLKEWWLENYTGAYNSETVTRWVRQGRISPAPEKHGREYRIRYDAVYLTNNLANHVSQSCDKEKELQVLLTSINNKIA